MSVRKKKLVISTTTSDKEGWLKKGKQLHKQQKRWFVLKDTALVWFGSPNGKVKGSIDVRNYHLVPIGKDTDEEYSFEIIPLEDNERKASSKTYWLTGKTRDVKDWIEAIRVAKRIVTSPPLSPTANAQETHSAWLVKKGAKRWFVLKDDILYWYSKELAADSEFFSCTQENGHIELGIGCSAFVNPKKESLTVRTSAGDTYILTARNEVEAEEWVQWLNKSIKSATIKKREKFENVLKSSILIKKGQNRFFVLNSKQLFWYPSQKEYIDNAKERGSIFLAGCETLRLGKSSFAIITSAPQPLAYYELIGGSESEVDMWVKLLQQYIATATPLVNESGQTQGWLSKKGKKRYFVLTADVLIWFTEIPGEKKSILTWPQLREAMSYNTNSSVGAAICKGNITLRGCVISIVQPEVLSIVTSTGKAYHLAGHSKVLERWLQALQKAQTKSVPFLTAIPKTFTTSMDLQKSGFLVKKGKTRWFLAVNGILMWFEKQQNLSTSKHAKGSVSLSDSSVVPGLEMTGDPNSFMLSTKKGTTYILTASTKEEADAWVTMLRKAISHANYIKQTSTNRLDESKSGWLQKESSKLNVKQRYFTLKNGLLMWFTSSGELNDMKVKGAIQLAGCSVSLSDALYLKTSQGKQYKLLGSEEELSGWLKALDEAIVRANQESESSFVIAKKNFSALKELLLEPSLIIPMTFTHVYQSDDAIANLISLFYMQNRHMSLLEAIVERELGSSGNIQESTLFRGDSVATKAVRAYFRIVALEWLQETLTPMIRTVTQHPDESFEVDLKKAQPSDDISANERKLSALALTFLETILASFHKFPNPAREFLNKVKQLVVTKYPNSRVTVVGGFVFLRFIVPCLFSPEGFDINLEMPPSQKNRRTLVLVAKILQNIANGVVFQKEEYMLCFNDLITEQKPRLAEHLEKISEPVTNTEKVAEPPIKIMQRTMAVVVKYLQDCQTLVNKEILKSKDTQKIELFHKLYSLLIDVE